MRIKVNTYFDITETGVNRPYKGQHLPTKIHNVSIKTADEWNLKRKQQNNLETVMQVLAMRGTINSISPVSRNNGIWAFSFDVNDTIVYGSDLQLLKEDLIGIPMTTGLTETQDLDSFLSNDNIWFETDV